jgi:hypothetical protein
VRFYVHILPIITSFSCLLKDFSVLKKIQIFWYINSLELNFVRAHLEQKNYQVQVTYDCETVNRKKLVLYILKKLGKDRICNLLRNKCATNVDDRWYFEKNLNSALVCLKRQISSKNL